MKNNIIYFAKFKLKLNKIKIKESKKKKKKKKIKIWSNKIKCKYLKIKRLLIIIG